MKEYIKQRVLDTANYMLHTRCTIRQASRRLRIPKTTIHTDVSSRLATLDVALYVRMRRLLEYNHKIGCAKGGRASAGVPRRRRQCAPNASTITNATNNNERTELNDYTL